MREVVIISGKGGTGKTSLTGAFAHLAKNKVLCDLDVDAPDLHLLLQPIPEKQEEFYSGYEAIIDREKCTRCGMCASLCRFGGIVETEEGFLVNPLHCEGCKVCVAFCPSMAIDFPERHCGRWYLSSTRFGPLVHAQLFPGQENSGRLVMVLKQKARELAKTIGADLLLCDGAPGIGCPVISSLSGANLAVAVTEPTPSGRHDLERVADLCGHFQTAFAVIVNKHDLNPEETTRIESFCGERGYPVLARLPHDPLITKAMVQGLAVTEMPGSDFGSELRQAWAQILTLVPSYGKTEKKNPNKE